MKTPANMVVLSGADNVGIALRDIAAGDPAVDAQGRSLQTAEAIPQGHKVALRPIGSGEKIIRFGVPVALAVPNIATGHLVHVHNVKSQYLNNDHDHYE